MLKTRLFSSAFVFTFFTILFSIGLAPINDAYAATTFVDAFDISAQETEPTDLVFNTDGTKMFVVGYVGDNVNEYACTTGFDVSTCSFTDAFSVAAQETTPTDLAFNTDGTKMFVVGYAGDDVNEYACTTGFDVSTCAFTDSFSVAAQETAPRGLAFNTDGTKMFVVGSSGDDVNEYTLSVGFDFDGVAAAEEEEENSSSDCYDCIPPTLQKAHITISSNEQIIMPSKDGNYNTDDPLHITANVGDKITVILNVTDNKSVDDFRFAGLYTNYQEKPSNMKTFYANNYDNLRQVSTSFYLWDSRADDIAYDYDGTVSWSDNSPEIVTSEINEDNFKFKNDENNVQYFMMPFTFTINDHMDSTQIVAKVYDGAYNRLHVALPVVLEVAGNDPLNFENLGKQKVLGFFDEAVLIQSISDWDDSQDNTEKLAQLLGVSKDSIPLWTVNLAKWVAEDKIDSANLIVAVEYLLNQ